MTDGRTDEREGKLPRWAQDLLEEARRREDRAVSKLNEHLATVEKSSVWYGDYENRIYVPTPRHYGARIHFNTAGRDELRDEFQVQLRGDRLEVSGGRSFAIHPQVSNVVSLRLT